MDSLRPFILVFFGAGIGGTLRHGVNTLAIRLLGVTFPYGTLIINITGCLVMGLIAGWLALRGETSQPWRLFLMTGILGGYTTFSAFSLDLMLLWERGEMVGSIAYGLASVIGSVIAVSVGLFIIRSISA